MEIIKTYRQVIPATTFVGIPYTNADRQNGSFGHLWIEWFESGRFAQLESLVTEDFKQQYEDYDAYVGFMTMKEPETFKYWIGMFLPPNVVVPEGFSSLSFDSLPMGICWVYGHEDELYCNEDACEAKLNEDGIPTTVDENGYTIAIERYVCPRFTDPDESGKQILDIGLLVK